MVVPPASHPSSFRIFHEMFTIQRAWGTPMTMETPKNYITVDLPIPNGDFPISFFLYVYQRV